MTLQMTHCLSLIFQPLHTDNAAVVAALSIRPCANEAAFLNWMSNLSNEALDNIKTDLESAVRTGNVKFLASILTDHLNEYIQAEASVQCVEFSQFQMCGTG